MFGFTDAQQENRVVTSPLLLIFKFNVYKSRDLKTLNFFVEMIFENRESIIKNVGN